MCFSASASFIASATLGVIGISTVRHASRRRKFLGMIPLFFSVQQLFEGLQWLADKPSEWSQFLGYGFLFFAFLVWPVWVPLAVLHLEINQRRRSILKVFLGVGIAISLYLCIVLLTHPLLIVPLCSSISYSISFPFGTSISAIYVIVTTGSFMVASDRRLKVFGLVVWCSAMVALFMYSSVFTSVWCFFAALCSVVLFWCISDPKKHPKKKL